MMPEWVIPILTIVIGSGGLIAAISAWVRDAKKAPIESRTAQVADAVAISHAAANFVEIQNARFAAQDSKIEKLGLEIESLRTQLYAWQIWYNEDLVTNWDSHRVKEDPPNPPKVINK